MYFPNGPFSHPLCHIRGLEDTMLDSIDSMLDSMFVFQGRGELILKER